MDSAALLASPLFGSRGQQTTSSVNVDTMKLPTAIQHIQPIQFRLQVHFDLNQDNDYKDEFVLQAPKRIENGRPWSVCVTKMEIGQYTCMTPGAEVYLQLDGPFSRSLLVDQYPDVELDYALPVGPFNNTMHPAGVYVGADPTRYDNVTQLTLARFGGHSSALDALADLEFDKDDKLVYAPPTSPLVVVARENRKQINGMSRNDMHTFCNNVDAKLLIPSRHPHYLCGNKGGRLMLLAPPDSTCTPVTGAITFQCVAKRIDLIGQVPKPVGPQ